MTVLALLSALILGPCCGYMVYGSLYAKRLCEMKNERWPSYYVEKAKFDAHINADSRERCEQFVQEHQEIIRKGDDLK